MRVLDGCVLVVDAVAGVQVQTQHVYRQASAPVVAAASSFSRPYHRHHRCRAGKIVFMGM
jgi:hypothetical protein